MSVGATRITKGGISVNLGPRKLASWEKKTCLKSHVFLMPRPRRIRGTGSSGDENVSCPIGERELEANLEDKVYLRGLVTALCTVSINK